MVERILFFGGLVKIAEANRNRHHGYVIFYHYRTNSNEPWKGFEPSIKEIRIDDTNLEQVLIDFRQFTVHHHGSSF